MIGALAGLAAAILGMSLVSTAINAIVSEDLVRIHQDILDCTRELRELMDE